MLVPRPSFTVGTARQVESVATAARFSRIAEVSARCALAYNPETLVRGVVAVIVGLVLWMVGFFTLAILLGQVWPDYRVHARTWMAETRFTFTDGMAVFNLVMWAIAACAAGWATVTIARRSGALWTLAAIVTGYLALLHLVLNWSQFPWWYNLGVVLPALPATLLGGRLAGGRQRAAMSRAAAS